MQSISENSSFSTDSNTFKPGMGGDSPLDLFNGHLRTTHEHDGYDGSIPYDQPEFTNLYHNGRPLESWLGRPHDSYEGAPFVLKVQPFASGGYEATIIKTDMEQIGRAMDGGLRGGKREKTEQKENDVISSKARAKKNVRLRIKSMGCDRMLTLTVRQSEQNQWTVEQWLAAWKKFIRLLKKAGCELRYVAVMEQHKTGAYHLHAAIVGKVNVKVMRGVWWSVCGGRGLGNVDIAFRRNVTDYTRRAGLARYVSKYITKQDCAEFNKKRYWSSRHKLPAAVRYVLSADSIRAALVEVAGMRSLNVAVLNKSVFIFPSETGAWFSFEEDMALPVPF